MSSHLNALAETETEGVQGVDVVQSPLQKFKHKTEGYAIDWSPLVPGRLISGDCNNSIYLWEPTSAATWNIDTTAFTGHTGSVEDLQWSPTEPNVFASCSVDKTIAIWDTRGRSPAASFKAHNADVNVLSWNRLASCMLASGSDDGTISIRDLRLLKEELKKHMVEEEGSSHDSQATKDSTSWKNDAYSKVKGPEKRGRVRCLGKLPRHASSSSNADNRVATLENLLGNLVSVLQMRFSEDPQVNEVL
ncbi:protein HEAT STRESS TOLERANT DWD 1-like isoform X1 [Vicia villosa]|uniref:protein HEAT STRESS TOLERANT DWD 1-like isoform X1 n=1 Tax=Vicia villosa TaxID=3911 RepID=UPI00273C345B|nr:protein HEAT STRESS TOLERANT DWD 1-like isoform X1 [Vicia villosa]XP_058740021.1 protein HEAT STRESS TOLERANT DWD 1-like isoform X1 [Vicia villosa]XP_058740022.1 protein HEAT STRESS TOLERANT DWD 1-like isoform X1 [Vicia villosa]XP_058740023.1 protein HEAT STRESS TOLERANT DWD 1-like isoform X1 [Vicia villosa]